MTTTIQAPGTGTIDRPETDLPGNDFYGQVVVRNDDTFPVQLVIIAFYQILPGMMPERVADLVCEIEANHQATVWSGTREACEMYVELLYTRGLDAYIG